MPVPPPPAGAVRRLGSAAFRFAGDCARLSFVPPHANTFVAWSSDPAVFGEYALADGSLLRSLAVPEGVYADSGSVSADGSRLLFDSPPTVVERLTGRVLLAVPEEAEGHYAALSADGRRLAVSLGDPAMSDYEVADGVEEEYRFSRGVACYDVDSGGKLWEARTELNFQVRPRPSPDGRVVFVTGEALFMHSDGDAPGGPTNFALVLDGASGRELARLPTEYDTRVLFFTPEGVATTGPGGSKVYDLKTGETAPLPVGDGISPDGNIVASLDRTTAAITRRDRWTGTVLDSTACPFPQPSGGDEADDIRVYVAAGGVVTALYKIGDTVFAWSAPDDRRV